MYEKVGEVMFGGPSFTTPLRRSQRQGRVNPRLISISLLDELVSGPAEAKEYGRMQRAVAEALGSVKAVKPPPFLDRRTLLGDAQAAGARSLGRAWRMDLGEGAADRTGDLRPFRLRQDGDEAKRSPRRPSGATPFARRSATSSATTAYWCCRRCRAPRRKATARPKNSAHFASARSGMLCWSGLSGFPQISLPLGAVHGAPFGISLLGPAGSDMALIRLGRVFSRPGRT